MPIKIFVYRREFVCPCFSIWKGETYSNFEKILGSKPTQLWTGGGRHFIQPQSAIVFEKIEEFKEFDQPPTYDLKNNY